MTHAHIAARQAPVRRLLLALSAAVIAVFALSALPATAAHAAEEPCDGAYKLSGNVKFNNEPLEGVKIHAEGNGQKCDATTDAAGQWVIMVAEKGEYKVTLNQDSLPEGVIVADGQDTVSAEFGLTKTKAVNFFLGEGKRVTQDLGSQVLQRVWNGLSFGLLLALAAIGVSLIFGTTGLSNFAHAEMITFGALMSLTFGKILGLNLGVAILLALVLSAAFGWGLDAGLWKPLRKRGVGVVQLMIVSIGLSLALRYTFQFFYGGETLQLPGATDPNAVTIGPILTSWVAIVSMAVSVVMLLATAFFLLRTRIGKATRAVSDNPALASASGIDVDRVIRIVWVISGLLAGLAGILWAYFRPGASWDMGFQILLMVFAAVTLGGLGTAFGALVGSLIVGLFTELSTLVLPSDMKYVGALLILIVMLLVRPQGILGRKERIG
ncbi:MAG TPA: branched-chain amino acid ABC transporter permease [Microbacteriaceae bacterium]|nr:branched-chain amino acid ABC transporter permease [Microbacteriaceae bacterium]